MEDTRQTTEGVSSLAVSQKDQVSVVAHTVISLEKRFDSKGKLVVKLSYSIYSISLYFHLTNSALSLFVMNAEDL